jgi:hypothetical protein
MVRIKLTIQNGHRNAANGQTGTSGEMDLIDKVYYAIKSIIDSKYSQIIELSYDDATVKNGETADYFLAPHFDGSTNTSYNGGFVDCSPESLTKDQDWQFAQMIADYYFGPMGITFAPSHRTANSTYYYAFNSTGEKTIQTIIELGTLTNADDKVKCQDYNKIARLLMEGIIAYLTKYDATYQAFIKNSTTTPTQTPTDSLQQENESLKKQVEDLKKINETLQTKTTQQLADKDIECQKRLSDVKQKIINYITSV